MAKQFGNTWWGQCWLNSLQGIYARQGAVRRLSHIIHYENPTAENQATDRAYRIGQDKNDAFEERIDEMTVATGENWLGKLSNKELHDIFETKE